MAELFFSIAQWAMSCALLLVSAIVFVAVGCLVPDEPNAVTTENARPVVFCSILGLLLLVAGVTVSHL